MSEVKKLVLTGGPCAGKTTAKNYLYEKLSDQGISIILVPEVATMIIESGLHPMNLPAEDMMGFQNLILKTQLCLENQIFAKAMAIKGGQKQTMIMDRGCMDGCAYMSKEDFERLLWRNQIDMVYLRERYDAVFHLVTAAQGKEKYYNLDNPARHETPEQARALDQRTQLAWIGHPHLIVIDNSTLFEDKMRRLLNSVRKTLGIPVAIETERKYLVDGDKFNPQDIPVPYQKIQIEQVYLKTEKGEVRIRRRSQDSAGSVYYKTMKLPIQSSLSRVEIEQQITADEYYAGLQQWDQRYDIIHKERLCFLWQNQYFELDIFTGPKRLRGLILLEIELTEENDKVEIPAWLGKVAEVTDNPNYSNKNLVRKT